MEVQFGLLYLINTTILVVWGVGKFGPKRITFAVPEYATYDFWPVIPIFWVDKTDATNSPERDIAKDATVYGSFEFAGIFHPTLFEGSASCTLAANTASKRGRIPTFTSPGAQG